MTLRLTDQQRAAIRAVKRRPGMTAREAADEMVAGSAPAKMTYDRAHGILRRLENRGLARRGGIGTSRWWLTDAGEALEV